MGHPDVIKINPIAFQEIARHCSRCGELCFSQECIPDNEVKCLDCFIVWYKRNYQKVKGGRVKKNNEQFKNRCKSS